MSVSCSIVYKNTIQKIQTIPVAAESDFAEYWRKPAIQLGMKHIPSLSDGLWIYESSEHVCK